jgi:hypothetical protein
MTGFDVRAWLERLWQSVFGHRPVPALVPVRSAPPVRRRAA